MKNIFITGGAGYIGSHCVVSLSKNGYRPIILDDFSNSHPNVMIGLHLDHFYVFWLEPLAVNKTKEHMQMYYVGDKSANGEELKELRKENARFWKEVMLEDISAIEGMQAGRGSPVYNGGNFSPVMDQPTHQFHKWVANSLL